MDKECPITDIQFVEKNNIPKFLPYKYTQVSFNDDFVILFSKERPQRPVTSLKVGPPPCKDPMSQANAPGAQFYETELMKTKGCEIDKRYQSSGLKTNEYAVQLQNGVLQNIMDQTSARRYVQEFGKQ